MKKDHLKSIPSAVWALGFVSMLMDISSEMVHAVLPLFLVAGLGSSYATVGLIEGIAEATGSITKAFSGALSDYLRKRKALAVAGYALSALTKPFFALATSPALVLSARFVDRIGKGIRGAPRDALLSEVSPPEIRGACFGLRQSLDTAGAVIGPLAAVLLLTLLANNYRAVFWIALLPGAAAVALLIKGVEDVRGRADGRQASHPHLQTIRSLPRAFWLIVLCACLMSLPRFGEAFIILRASSNGVPSSYAPAALIVMNAFYAVTSYPAGRLSDRFGRLKLLAASMAVLAVSNLILGVSGSVFTVAAGSALWGIQMGLSQGLLGALVAETTAPDLRGTAYGVLHCGIGLSLLLSGLLGGITWDYFGAAVMFLTGAALAVIACFAVFGTRRAWSHTAAGGSVRESR